MSELIYFPSETCWRCGRKTRERTCDADGSGVTGYVWPAHCWDCKDHYAPVKVAAYRERFPKAHVTAEPATESNKINQAFYRIMARRGVLPEQMLKETE